MSGTETARGRNSYCKLFVSYNKNVNLKGKKKLSSFLKLCPENNKPFYENIFGYRTFFQLIFYLSPWQTNTYNNQSITRKERKEKKKEEKREQAVTGKEMQPSESPRS